MLHSLLLYIFIHSVLVYDMNFAKTSGQLSANCPRPGFMVFSCTVGSLPIQLPVLSREGFGEVGGGLESNKT